MKMFKLQIAAVASLIATSGFAQDNGTPINGVVQSRCIIQTDNAGTYGNPNAYTLTTSGSDGVKCPSFVLTFRLLAHTTQKSLHQTRLALHLTCLTL